MLGEAKGVCDTLVGPFLLFNEIVLKIFVSSQTLLNLSRTLRPLFIPYFQPCPCINQLCNLQWLALPPPQLQPVARPLPRPFTLLQVVLTPLSQASCQPPHRSSSLCNSRLGIPSTQFMDLLHMPSILQPPITINMLRIRHLTTMHILSLLSLQAFRLQV